ncbi:MAG: sigma-70 family RNA polymerase sigma factor [Planctomycetes bacterium]|nr:sigma-70 family RNA polymerase sigma factor [Planctomycetota bacterium]
MDHKSASSPSTSLSLLERVRTHDQEAWERLVYIYGPLVQHWCRKYRLQSQDMDEQFQDVWGAVFERIGGFRREQDGDSFRGWLWTITRNKLCDRFRKMDQQPQAVGGTDFRAVIEAMPDSEPADIAADGASPLVENPAHRAARLIRSDFEEPTWRAFWAVAVEGRQPAEVADDLGMKRDSVYQAKSRVLKRLREELDGLLD